MAHGVYCLVKEARVCEQLAEYQRNIRESNFRPMPIAQVHFFGLLLQNVDTNANA